jgi:hypothetical protein
MAADSRSEDPRAGDSPPVDGVASPRSTRNGRPNQPGRRGAARPVWLPTVGRAEEFSWERVGGRIEALSRDTGAARGAGPAAPVGAPVDR